MNKKEILILVAACVFVFLVVYSPHLSYPLPFHVDEWYHITETGKIANGEYKITANMFRIGFDLFLLPFLYIFDLVKIYQFLPAIWAVLSALVLFFITKKKTENYWIALFAVLFFASLKSNVNIQGLWFFIPSVFCIPLIYLYVYFFTEGIDKENKKYILWSLGVMLAVLFVHSVSLFFAIPFLFVYALFKRSYLKKEWKFFSLFLLIPILGFILYLFAKKVSLIVGLSSILSELIFLKGRLPLELNNSPFEIYSLVGYLFVFLGIYYIWKNKEIKKYLVYLLWFIFLLVSILIFKMFGISFLAPYQRVFYYFAISLPLLSALGLYHLLKLKDCLIDRNAMSHENKLYLKKFLTLIVVLVTLFFMFYSYYELPGQTNLYKLINQNDYNALQFLKNQSSGRVMAPTDISMASYAVSGKMPTGALYFYGNKTVVGDFFKSTNCTFQNRIIRGYNVSYVLTEKPIECNWTLIYKGIDIISNKTDLIYNVYNISNPVKVVKSKINK